MVHTIFLCSEELMSSWLQDLTERTADEMVGVHKRGGVKIDRAEMMKACSQKEHNRVQKSAEKPKEGLGGIVNANVTPAELIKGMKYHIEDLDKELRSMTERAEKRGARIDQLEGQLDDMTSQRDAAAKHAAEAERRCKELDERLTAATRFIGQAYLDGREGRNG